MWYSKAMVNWVRNAQQKNAEENVKTDQNAEMLKTARQRQTEESVEINKKKLWGNAQNCETEANIVWTTMYCHSATCLSEQKQTISQVTFQQIKRISLIHSKLSKPSPRWLFNKLNQEFPHLIQNYLISLFIVPTFQANCQITSSILSLNLTQVCVFVFVSAFVLFLVIFLSQTEKSYLYTYIFLGHSYLVALVIIIVQLLSLSICQHLLVWALYH